MTRKLSKKYCDFFNAWSRRTIIHKIKGKKTLCLVEIKNANNLYESYPVMRFSGLYEGSRVDKKCKRCWKN